MRFRALIGCAVALLATTLVHPATAEAARATGPHDATTTMRLLGSGKLQVVSTGIAPAGARVRLQDRSNRHQRWATVASARAGSRGGYRLVTTRNQSPQPVFRTCVVRPGRDACTKAGTPKLLQRQGAVTLTSFPAELVPGKVQTITGTVTRWLRTSHFAVEYRTEPTGPWSDPVGLGPAAVTGATFQVDVESLPVGDPDLQVRVVAIGDRFVAAAHSAVRTTWSNVLRPLTDLPVVGGSYVAGQPSFYPGHPVEAVSPDGGPVTFALAGKCRGYRALAVVDFSAREPGDTYAASVALDGVTAWSGSGPDGTVELDLTGRQQLTLTASDSSSPQRMWFGQGYRASDVGPGRQGGSVACAF